MKPTPASVTDLFAAHECDTSPEVLAREFQAATVGSTSPWPAAFQTWADARGLSEREAREVRTAVIRARVFGRIATRAKRVDEFGEPPPAGGFGFVVGGRGGVVPRRQGWRRARGGMNR